MEKEKIRNDKYLNYIVPLIVKGIHWGQEYIANSEDQEKIIMDELTDFIQQELDKAREEVLIELQKEFSEFGVPDDVRYTQPLFYINEVIEKKLSKLKTKEDGK